MLFISFPFAFLVLFPGKLICTSQGFLAIRKFWNLLHFIWTSYWWQVSLWAVAKPLEKKSVRCQERRWSGFQGLLFCRHSGQQVGHWGQSHCSHTQTHCLSFCWLSVLGCWRTNGWAREKAVPDVSYSPSPFLYYDNSLPHKPLLHAHTVSRYLTKHWLAEVSIYNYLTEEKEKLIETHLRLHTL